MESPRRSALRRAAAALAAFIALALAGPAAAPADTPNKQGVAVGSAESAPTSPAYEAPRPEGAGTGRKIR